MPLGVSLTPINTRVVYPLGEISGPWYDKHRPVPL